VAGSLIDGSGGEIRRNVFLAMRNGIITSIGSAADLPPTPGTTIVDLSHCIILPPLVDCSVSMTRSPALDRRVRSAADEGGLADKAAMLEQHIGYCHSHGVLGVADCDDPIGLTARYPGRPPLGDSIEIRTSGPLIRNPEDYAGTADTDFLKIAYSTDIEEGDAAPPRLSPEDLHRIMGQKGGRKAVVVANGRQQVAEALSAGCDAIEQGYLMGEGNLRKMAERQVLWIPSLVRARNGLDGASGGGDVACRFSTRYVAPGKSNPGAEALWKKLLADQMAQLRLAGKLGVTTAVGTGAGSIGILHGESVVEEMKLFIKAGWSLEETVRCATENGARFFGMKKLGALTIGHQATFLITRGAVQQLPRKLAYLEGVYIDGVPSATYRKNPVKRV